MICAEAHSQTQLRGVNVTGTTVLSTDQDSLIAEGIVARFKSDKGVVKNGTNVQTWVDLTYSGFNASNYSPTNQPSHLNLGTNLFGQSIKGVFFSGGGGGSPHLKCDPLATLFSGNSRPMTVIMLVRSQVANTANTALAFGYSASTNANASRTGIRPNSSPSSDSLYYRSSNTNNATTSVTVSGGSGQNVWRFTGFTFNGTTKLLTAFNNLSPTASIDLSGETTLTLDLFTIGGLRNQSTLSQQWFGGIADILVFTNGLSGTSYTNTINFLNSSYRVLP